MTPRLRAATDGDRQSPWKWIEALDILARCCGVPISQNSVLAGLTERRLTQNQIYTRSKI